MRARKRQIAIGGENAQQWKRGNGLPVRLSGIIDPDVPRLLLIDSAILIVGDVVVRITARVTASKFIDTADMGTAQLARANSSALNEREK